MTLHPWIAAALVAAHCHSPALGAPPEDVDAVVIEGDRGRALDAFLRSLEANGYWGAVLVARGGRVVLAKGYGYEDAVTRRPNRVATRFEIASLTKTFTAAAILRLEEEGRLGADDPVRTHLGDFPPEKSAVTIEHLASHTGGLVREGAWLAYGDSRDEFVGSVKATPMETAPGAAFRYTNAGYSVLAAVVERVSGTSFEAYVREALFARAGLRTADFRGAPGGVARGHVSADKPSDPQPYPWGTRGAGGILMSVADLHRWHTALHGGSVLGAEARAKMFRARPAEAWGWHVDARPDLGGTLVHKGGGMPDFASQILYVPEKELVAIWTCNNLTRRWRRALNKGLIEIAEGRPYGIEDALREISTPAAPE